MNEFLFLIFMIFVVIRIIITTQKSATAGAKKTTVNNANIQNRVNVQTAPRVQTAPQVKVNNGVNRQLSGGTAGSAQVVNVKNRTTLAALSASMENRGNDWLARQLAEERIIKRKMSDMFELKSQHSRNCDAADNRARHMANCDARGIDTAGY